MANVRYKYLITFLLGFSSGLPLALTGNALKLWFTDAGLPLTTIALTSLVGIPYTLKFLWAPFLDNYWPKFLGRRRSWILLSQLALSISLLMLSFGKLSAYPLVPLLLAFLVAFASSTQDAVVDAYRIDIFNASQYPMGAACGVNGYRLGILVSGGFGLLVAEAYSWQIFYQTMALLLLLSMAVTLLAPKEQLIKIERQPLLISIIAPIQDFFQRNPKAIWVILFIIFYKIGDAFIGSLALTFLRRELHLSLAQIGILVKLSSFSGIMIGGFLGAYIMQVLGLWRSLFILGILQALSNLVYLALLYLPTLDISINDIMLFKNISLSTTDMVVGGAMFLENLFDGMANATYIAWVMGLCNKRYGAAQFALLTSVSAIGRTFIAPIAGLVSSRYGWQVFFLSSLVLAVPGLLILAYLGKSSLFKKSNN